MPCRPQLATGVQAKRSKAVLPLLEGAKRAILLSGTPLPSKAAEVFTQLCALLPTGGAASKRHDALAAVFCETRTFGFKTDRFAGSKRPEELHCLLVRFHPTRQVCRSHVLSGRLLLALHLGQQPPGMQRLFARVTPPGWTQFHTHYCPCSWMACLCGNVHSVCRPAPCLCGGSKQMCSRSCLPSAATRCAVSATPLPACAQQPLRLPSEMARISRVCPR